MDKALQDIYYNPKESSSFQGPTKLLTALKKKGFTDATLKDVRAWLKGVDVYTMTRPAKHKFNKGHIIADGLNNQWQSDLAYVGQLSKENDGINYLLVCIDVFSRKLYVRSLKTKQSTEMIKAFSSIITSDSHPMTLRTDGGSEYCNKTFEKYLKKMGIKHYIARSEGKAVLAERCIRTLKDKLYRYILFQNNPRYLDVLQDLVDSYNDTLHGTTGWQPSSVTKQNQDEVRLAQYMKRHKKREKRRPYAYNEGDVVRISYVNTAFQRTYDIKFSGELFKIHSRSYRGHIPVYTLVDWADDPILGVFYEPELTGVTVSEDKIYKIEKVIRCRVYRGQRQVLVKWLYFPRKFNSWIDASSVEEYS